MSHVEKYGLFAVLLLGGVGLTFALQGCNETATSESQATAAAAATRDGKGPVIIARSEPVEAAEAPRRRREPKTLRVPSLIETDAPFTFDEAPVPYPGEHSVDGRASSRPAAAPVTYVIGAGDTLGDIAREHYGTSSRWKDIAAANPGLDPNRLAIGTEIVIPSGAAPAAPAVPAATAHPRTYEVQAGDTLGEIAARVLGSARLADRLFEANRDVLASPDQLRVGQVLTIP